MNLKILAVIGSPRRKGNTDILLSAIAERVGRHAAHTEIIRLYEHRIGPYEACMRCAIMDQCAKDDYIWDFHPKIKGADKFYQLIDNGPTYIKKGHRNGDSW